jgi:hypothetical protein
VLHEADKALVGRLFVLRLASSVTRNNPNHSVRVESRGELRARRSRSSSVTATDRGRSQSSSMRVDDVLTCCPPAPLARVALY